MTVRVFTPEGEALDLSAQEAEARFARGEVAFDSSQPVSVRASDGRIGTVSAAELDTALGEGFTIADPAVAREANVTRELGEQGGRTFLERAASTATFGVSDQILTSERPALRRSAEAVRGLGAPDDPTQAQQDIAALPFGEAMRRRAEENPISAGAGEVAGIVGPAVLSGGGALGARTLAGGASGVVSRGALGVERAIVGAASRGIGEGFAARSLGRAAGVGASGAIEGAAFGTGRAVSQAALNDTPLTGEALATGARDGAVLGLAGGAVLGGSLSLARSAVAPVGRALTRAFTPRGIDNAIDQLAFGGLGATSTQVRDAMRRAGGTARIGRDALENGWIDAGSGAAEVARRVTADMADRIGPRLGAVLRQADELVGAGRAANPDAGRVLLRIQREVLEATDQPFRQGVFRALRTHSDDALQRFARAVETPGGAIEPLGFVELHGLRRNLDQLAFPGASPQSSTFTNPTRQGLRQMRAIIEEELTASIGRAGPGALPEYLGAKRLYESARAIREIAFGNAARNEASGLLNMHSLGLGVAIGAATGNPAAIAVGFLSGAVQNLTKRHGKRVAAVGLDRIAKRLGFREIVDGVERQVSTAARKVVRGNVTTGIPAVGLGIELFDDTVNEVTAAAANPSGYREQIMSEIDDLSVEAPGAAQAYAAARGRGLEHMVSLLPPGMTPDGTLMPHLANPGDLVSDSEKAAYMQAASVVANPMVVFDEMERGTVTFEQVDTLRVVYPALYQSFVTEVVTELSQLSEPPDYDTLLQLATLLPDVPLDPSLSSGAIARAQEPYLEAHAAQAEGGGGQAAPVPIDEEPTTVQMTKTQQLVEA